MRMCEVIGGWVMLVCNVESGYNRICVLTDFASDRGETSRCGQQTQSLGRK